MPFSRQHKGLEVVTEPKMPPFGVAEALVDGRALLTQHGDLFRFWLLTHADANCITGPAFWRTGVLRECLPPPDAALDFIALGEPLS